MTGYPQMHPLHIMHNHQILWHTLVAICVHDSLPQYSHVSLWIYNVRSYCTSLTQQLITHGLYLLVHTLNQTPVPVDRPCYIYGHPAYIPVPKWHGYLTLPSNIHDTSRIILSEPRCSLPCPSISHLLMTHGPQEGSTHDWTHPDAFSLTQILYQKWVLKSEDYFS